MIKCPECGRLFPDEIQETVPGLGFSEFVISLVECECGAVWAKPSDEFEIEIIGEPEPEERDD